MRAVAIGGGHGLSRSLKALTGIADHVTAVVTVADDGGSSGRLRRDLGVAPPGDLRMALAALARNESLASLLQYRFDRGELDGHALGNLLIVAMADLRGGSLVAALDALCVELHVQGRVLPCTTEPLILHAEGPAGTMQGQERIAKAGPPSRLWVEPADATATPDALTAIAAADVIVLGPGSVYTSILPNLVVKEVGEAVLAAEAPIVLVANMREQPGETEGMTLVDHLDALTHHLPGLVLDAVIAHEGPRPAGPGAPLTAHVLTDHPAVAELVTADLLDGSDGHDPACLGAVVASLCERLGAVAEPAREPR